MLFNCFGTVEDQYHVILHCPIYYDLKQILFIESLKIDKHFNSLTDCQKSFNFYFRTKYYKIMCQHM